MPNMNRLFEIKKRLREEDLTKGEAVQLAEELVENVEALLDKDTHSKKSQKKAKKTAVKKPTYEYPEEKLEISRTAPKGRRSVISERAVESLNKENEKLYKKTVSAIGKSTGFH